MEGIRQPSSKNQYYFDSWRITVLTTKLLRLEYSARQHFEDRHSQIVVDRNFDMVACTFSLDGDAIRVETADVCLWVSQNTFDFAVRSPLGGQVWSWGDPLQNLGGTARTLDNADGPIPLEDGIFSKEGIGILEDRSCLQNCNGEFIPRTPGHKDIYLFVYGKQYEAGLRAFYQLTGKTPLLPRFALGNWWSRFWPYTQEAYLALMDRFEKEHLPFSVAVLDMDWHLTKVPAGYSGWTGYTWNRELLPDPTELLRQLHSRGMKVTLNLHPADGVQCFEEGYPAMKQAMGVSPDSQATIPFDFTDSHFRQGYFDILLRTRENDGVDFWWIDWQQGTESEIPGLDPLWLLNHYHFLDASERGKRPLILSRYAGPGSHRYPIGFSGDTVVSWNSLQFQPCFTATAANIGYGWWSHDIGGHMKGAKDDELACRWLQFGVFSPINRLHSTCNRFTGKEPWNYRQDIREIMGQFLRLRHELVPYLYSMNYRNHLDGVPLVRPMYHTWPEKEDAYRCPNQYTFGSQLIVAPVLMPQDRNTCFAQADVWLPDGIYYDFFTGIRYKGGRWLRAYRALSSIPVFVRAGGIVPMCDAQNPDETPACIYLRIYPGEDGLFSLYEDDGSGDHAYAKTNIQLVWKERTLVIEPGSDLNCIPEHRCFVLNFCGMEVETVSVQVGADTACIACRNNEMIHGSSVVLPAYGNEKSIKITLQGWSSTELYTRKRELFRLLERAQIEIDRKEEVYCSLEQNGFSGLSAPVQRLPAVLQGAIAEILELC